MPGSQLSHTDRRALLKERSCRSSSPCPSCWLRSRPFLPAILYAGTCCKVAVCFEHHPAAPFLPRPPKPINDPSAVPLHYPLLHYHCPTDSRISQVIQGILRRCNRNVILIVLRDDDSVVLTPTSRTRGQACAYDDRSFCPPLSLVAAPAAVGWVPVRFPAANVHLSGVAPPSVTRPHPQYVCPGAVDVHLSVFLLKLLTVLWSPSAAGRSGRASVCFPARAADGAVVTVCGRAQRVCICRVVRGPL